MLEAGYLMVASVHWRTRRIGFCTSFARWIPFELALYIPLMIAIDDFDFVSAAGLLQRFHSSDCSHPGERAIPIEPPNLRTSEPPTSSHHAVFTRPRRLLARCTASGLNSSSVTMTIMCRWPVTYQTRGSYSYSEPQHWILKPGVLHGFQ